MSDTDVIHIAPQPGPQTQFAECSADIAFFGGSAGGGKSFSLLMEVLRHYDNPEFTGVIFRRNATQVKNKGGLWDESMKLYKLVGAKPNRSEMSWHFPSNGSMKFTHLESEDTVYNHQGAQYAFIGFDEITHFSRTQVFYMLSRVRSVSGIKGYIRGTCNPDADSWVREMIDWWIDEDGYAIPERSGVLRWFVVRDDKLIWADTKEELEDEYGKNEAKSFTFIRSSLEDNAILMEKDPSYLSNLNAQSRVERARLKDGNWNIRPSSGNIFKREWFPIIDAIPSGWTRGVRFWDRAASKPSEMYPDPDWTRGLLMYKYPDGSYVVADLKSMRDTPGQVEHLIKNTATHDSSKIKIVCQQDPGSAGVEEAHNFVKMLSGYHVRTIVISKNKLARALPVSAQSEVFNIKILRAPWNLDFFSELESFPDGAHDDIVDVLSGAYNELNTAGSIFDTV